MLIYIYRESEIDIRMWCNDIMNKRKCDTIKISKIRQLKLSVTSHCTDTYGYMVRRITSYFSLSLPRFRRFFCMLQCIFLFSHEPIIIRCLLVWYPDATIVFICHPISTIIILVSDWETKGQYLKQVDLYTHARTHIWSMT